MLRNKPKTSVNNSINRIKDSTLAKVVPSLAISQECMTESRLVCNNNEMYKGVSMDRALTETARRLF
jgi:hypothetical protein